jgi:hypothetical protein
MLRAINAAHTAQIQAAFSHNQTICHTIFTQHNTFCYFQLQINIYFIYITLKNIYLS